MPFKPVNPKISFPELEKDILGFWEKEKIFEKSLNKESPKGSFVFYEGPPTANGKPGLHHVLARAFKDVLPRYKTMRGFTVPRKAGWDTHGLPVEIEVEKKLGISGKQDIEKIKATPEESIIEFNKLCKESVFAYKKEWEEMTKRMGFWLDMDHPYITYENNYIESVWWVVSQAFKKGLFFKGHKIVPYCPRCGTALSSHELAQGYKEVEDKSIYIKFELEDEPGTFFLVWTTTPWTLPGNIALAVNKDIEYIKLTYTKWEHGGPEWENRDVAKGEATIIASRQFFEQHKSDKNLHDKYNMGDYKTIKGSELLGKKYKQLYPFIIPEKKAFYVISGDFVSDSDGTGIVHIAPAYGEEDYVVGKENDLPVLMTLDKEGKMLPEITSWAGLGAKESDPLIIEDLKKRDLLFDTEMYKHDYPFCWRCDTALLYYAKDSWFIEMTKLKDELVKNNENINWVPDNIKHGRFGEWLEGVKDWAISRDRYWGTPLPVWQCEKCRELKCISSIEELKNSSDFDSTYPSDLSLDLHRPYIDKITFACDCGGVMTRVPEVMDVWLDSGTMPYSQLHYPFDPSSISSQSSDNYGAGNKEMPLALPKYFPADFISEAVDQTRGWFYTLHAISTFLGMGNCFKNVICLGHILDSKGQKMSKSKGNMMDPMEVANVHGFDAIRWYMYTNNQPGEPKLVSDEAIKDQVRRFLLILWNTYSFFVTYANIKDLKTQMSNVKTTTQNSNLFDAWLISRKNKLIKEVTNHLEKYDIFSATRRIEEFVVELSTWYLRRNKKRDDAEFLQVLHETLVDIVKLLAPFTPFVAEEIYKNLTGKESVHLDSWPEFDESLINTALEHEMKLAREIIEAGHAIRKEKVIKVRQPLSAIEVLNFKPKFDLNDIILDELNVKKIDFVDTFSEGGDWFKKEKMLGDLSVPLVSLNLSITPDLKSEGDMREIVRLIQDARKEARYAFSDEVKCYFQTDSQELKDVIAKFSEEIKKQTILSDLKEGIEKGDIEKESEIDRQKITISLKK
ncbi:MAG: isoleucine--tRNA ligase [Patescibacteria group bacterium]|nr:isoleucine--tRNA ligase [Patescibacteria group bacterium]